MPKIVILDFLFWFFFLKSVSCHHLKFSFQVFQGNKYLPIFRLLFTFHWQSIRISFLQKYIHKYFCQSISTSFTLEKKINKLARRCFVRRHFSSKPSTQCIHITSNSLNVMDIHRNIRWLTLLTTLAVASKTSKQLLNLRFEIVIHLEM